MVARCCFFSILVLLQVFPVSALPLAAADGVPFARHFTPREIGGGPQVLVSAKGADGVLYFAANRSVLEYDGVRWRRVGIPTPRGLAVDSKGRIWVGCDGDFGYLETSEPQLEFVSLLDTLPQADRPTQSLKTAVAVGETVYFLYPNQIIRISDGVPHAWNGDSEDVFLALAVMDDEVYVYRQGLGLSRWSSESGGLADPAVVAPATSAAVRMLLPWHDGQILLATEDGRVLRWQNQVVSNLSAELNDRLAGRPVYQLRKLRDGRLAVASRGAGLLLLAADGVVERAFTAATGLPNDDIYSVLPDAQGSLWLGHADGITRLSASPLSFYNGYADSPTAMTCQAEYQGVQYIGAMNGGFRLRQMASFEPARLQRIPGLDSTVWDWAVTPYGLLAATQDGIYRVGPERATPMGDRKARIGWHSEDEVLFVVTGSDLEIWSHSAQGWHSVGPGYLGLLSDPVAEVVPETSGVIWLVTMGTRTLYRLQFSGGFESAPDIASFELAFPWPRPLWLDGQLLFRVGPEVKSYESDSGGRLVPDGRFAIADWIPPGEDRFELKSLANGELWLIGRDRLRRLEVTPDGSFQPTVAASFGLPVQLNFDTRPEAEEPVLWLATDLGPARFDTRAEPSPTASPLIRFIPPANLLRRSESGMPVLAHNPAAFRFEVGLPFFLEESLKSYRYRLVGLDSDWSTWTREPAKEYTNLPGRNYSFEVEARHGDRWLGRSRFELQVLPPWYHTAWARILFALCSCGLILFYVRGHRRELARERSIAEREREASRQLRSADRLKDEILTHTSHEIRTPLQGITGLAESLIREPKLSKSAKGSLSMIAASGRRLNHLVDDILDVSRLNHGKMVLSRKAVDLRPLVEAVLMLSQPLIGSKDIELINSVPRDLPPADGDEHRLQQVFHNLVSNAIKFTDAGRVAVSAQTRAADQQLLIRVTDTGVGIPQDEHQSIFNAFEQADSALGKQQGGSGLGLAVARQLIELHGGNITIESAPGQGATFFVSLPIADATGQEISTSVSDMAMANGIEAMLTETVSAPELLESTDRKSTDRKSTNRESTDRESTDRYRRAQPGSDQATARVLVVDDEPVNRLILSSFLSDGHYEVHVAANGEDALMQLQESRFDLLLLDVMMPKMSGYEVCRELRRTWPREELPVIFLTARGETRDVVAGLKVGANDYLSKPISHRELLARIEPHLELIRIHRHLEAEVAARVAQVKVLGGLLPICASCKKIRDDEGYWSNVEEYIDQHSEATFSHGMCPGCFDDYQRQIQEFTDEV